MTLALILFAVAYLFGACLLIDSARRRRAIRRAMIQRIMEVGR